jgi:hypothetical protein
MNWPSMPTLSAGVRLPAGYEIVCPSASDVPALVRAVDDWFPGLAVGNASCFLRPEFYLQRVALASMCPQLAAALDHFVLLFRRVHDGQWAGLLAVERDRDSQVLYGRVGTVARAHRGGGVSKTFPPLMEAIGRSMGLGMVYGLVTLRTPHMQHCMEQAGWRLVGMMPGFDREVVELGVVKRVYEAVYVRVLADAGELLQPNRQHMTLATRELFDLLYGTGAPRGKTPAFGTDTVS